MVVSRRLKIICLAGLFAWFNAVAQDAPLFFSKISPVIDSCQNPKSLLQLDPIFGPRIPIHPKPAITLFRQGHEFRPASADHYFYLLCGLLVFVGISRRAFPKYYSDLYRVFSQTGFRQKSIRDQLLQNKLASIGLNTIFFISGGIFIYLISLYKSIMPQGLWYVQVLICIGLLLAVYGTKYLALMTGGWVFGASEMMNNYSFMVFFVNKIAGIILLPVIIILWLGNPVLHPSMVVIAFIAISLLFLYRFFLVLPMVRNKSGVSSFHFFIYLCTFEILPILLLVKFLVNFLNTAV